ncbi:MAG: triose-phosphate isomerase [Zavarzinella sp.]
MRKKFIAGNWKMYTTATQAVDLAKAVAGGSCPANVQVAVCPPSVWLSSVGGAIQGTSLALGAQNCHFAKEGAYTGELSPQMLLEVGCKYVIVGHSERRHGLVEPDLFLNRKVHAATNAGLSVIFCVGELESEQANQQTEAVLNFQLSAGLAGLSAAQAAQVVIAYEPVWAIGTGKVATPAQAQSAHLFIRQRFAALFGQAAADQLLIQYGGSVKADNAKEILHQPDVDGALVGGASLKPDQFLAIIAAGAV